MARISTEAVVLEAPKVVNRNGKRPRVEKPKKSRVDTYDIRKICPPKDVAFDDEYDDDMTRIRINSEKYKDCTILEAFADYYGFKSKAKAAEPITPSIGSIISVRLAVCNKRETMFTSDSVKEQLQSNVDLFKYAKFKDFNGELSVKVVRKEAGKLICDPFAGTFDEWANRVTGKNVPVTITQLHHVKGGFTGRVQIDTLSAMTGETTYTDAFIPGSQIVLNIERNFEKWEGQTVLAYVDNITEKPYSDEKCVVCSVKRYLQDMGNNTLVNWYNMMSDNDKAWDTLTNTPMQGIVTGIINSQKKQGVFVELLGLNITTLIPMEPEKLANYIPESIVNVKLKTIDTTTYFNSVVGQTQHNLPYEMVDGKPTNVNIITEFEMC